jgi:hypothetical protein
MENFSQDYTDNKYYNQDNTDRKYSDLDQDQSTQNTDSQNYLNQYYTNPDYTKPEDTKPEETNPYLSSGENSEYNSYNYTSAYTSSNTEYTGYSTQNPENESGNEYSSNDYSSYNSQTYGSATGYNQPGYSEQEYLELESEKRALEEEVEGLESQRGVFRITTVIFGLLFALCAGYVIYSELDEPLFGKWPAVAAENTRLKDQVADLSLLQLRIDSLVSVNNTLSEQSDIQDGIFFEVQIGAFQHFNMDQYMENLARLKKERVDVMDKYTLGKFRDFKQAESFNSDIKRMGIADAFIVAKMDGQRVDVLEAKKASQRKLY